MSVVRNLMAISSLVLGFIVLSGISGCDESKDIQNWVDNVSKLRTAALKQSEVKPYRDEQYNALKDYFAEINQMALALKNDSKLAERFNDAFGKVDPKQTCAKVLVQRPEWEFMMRRCTKNRFFLCSEEVRAYPTLVSALREKLKPEQQKRFDQTSVCWGALKR